MRAASRSTPCVRDYLLSAQRPRFPDTTHQHPTRRKHRSYRGGLPGNPIRDQAGTPKHTRSSLSHGRIPPRLPALGTTRFVGPFPSPSPSRPSGRPHTTKGWTTFDVSSTHAACRLDHPPRARVLSSLAPTGGLVRRHVGHESALPSPLAGVGTRLERGHHPARISHLSTASCCSSGRLMKRRRSRACGR